MSFRHRFAMLCAGLLCSALLLFSAADATAAANSLEDPETPTYGEPARSVEEIFGVMASTMSGEVLKKCLIAAAEAGIDGEWLPPPTKTAFAEYVSEYMFYDFEPGLFWPHYPGNWQEGMRAVLKHALEVGYEEENLNRAVELLPVFFKDGVGLEECTSYKNMHRAAYYNVWPKLSAERTKVHRAGVSHWARAVWNAADADRRQEIVDLFFMKSLVNDGPVNNLDGDDWWCFETGLFPLREWFRENPDMMMEYLQHPSRDLRQWTAILVAGNDPIPDLGDPVFVHAMVEGLASDSIPGNHRQFPKLLVRLGEEALPAMREAFAASEDIQQQLILAELLTWMDDKESAQARLELLYAGLVSAEMNPDVDPHWGRYAIGFPAGFDRRHRYVPMRLLWMGQPAAEFLLKKVAACDDPQQLALSLAVIYNLGAMDRVMWTNHMTDVLARGLEDNNVSYDLGFCAMALRMAGNRPLARLEAIAAGSGDQQLKNAVVALKSYHFGDLETYKNLWVRPVAGSKRMYWEYDWLARDRIPEQERRWNTIVTERGDETYLSHFRYRYGLQ